ncbi:uncharacterized protein LOC126377923 [Pectinophora gossypiella]|nr:uncharacterized protein LOC126377923 [Pectinophora gossypiella]
MDRQNALKSRDRFLKLSLKKNRPIFSEETRKQNRSSDCIILDESFERLRSDFPKKLQSSPKIYSPIVIDDSDELCDDLPHVIFDKEPSKAGNVSFNCSKEDASPVTQSRPSIGGWSPAQSILCATPKYKTIPSTPRDVANESLEDCTMKTIQHSQKKLLNDLYGETWKSIPTLFKTIKQKYDSIEGISKKLYFNDDDDSDKENIRKHLEINRKLYLTGSDTKSQSRNDVTDNKKSKKKLYTEKVPSTPDIPRQKPVKPRNASTTVKKKKGMSVTELVETMKDDVELLTRKVESVHVKAINDVTKTPEINRLSFVGSLADNIPSWRCHTEALQYHDNYKTLREQLSRRLFVEFNSKVFADQLDADMSITWDTKLRSTAGTTTNRLIKNASGDRIRTSSVKLSSKVVDGPQRLRDTLVHELCHAATWLLDGELRAGHGPLWKKWATRALRVFPELGEISRCHNMEIHYKYSYKCTQCGYSIQRHSKSIDVTKKCCGYCRGHFEVIVNKKKKDGVIVSTPARKGGPNDFALFVKENYSTFKDGSKTHAQVMKILGEQFSAKKNKVDT